MNSQYDRAQPPKVLYQDQGYRGRSSPGYSNARYGQDFSQPPPPQYSRSRDGGHTDAHHSSSLGNYGQDPGQAPRDPHQFQSAYADQYQQGSPNRYQPPPVQPQYTDAHQSSSLGNYGQDPSLQQSPGQFKSAYTDQYQGSSEGGYNFNSGQPVYTDAHQSTSIGNYGVNPGANDPNYMNQGPPQGPPPRQEQLPPQQMSQQDEQLYSQKSQELEMLQQMLKERENEINQLRSATASAGGNYQEQGGAPSYGEQAAAPYQPRVGQLSQPPTDNPREQNQVYDAGMSRDPYMAANLAYAQGLQAPPRADQAPPQDYGQYGSYDQAQQPGSYGQMGQQPGYQDSGPPAGSYQDPPGAYQAPQESYSKPPSRYQEPSPDQYQQPPVDQPPPQEPSTTAPDQSAPPDFSQMSNEQIQEYHNRISKAEYDRYKQQSMSRELVHTLEDQRSQLEQKKSEAKLKSDVELQQRLEHLRKLEEEDRALKLKRMQEQDRYKQDLDALSMAKRDISYKEDMTEQMQMAVREQDLVSHQPAGFQPTNHLYMYGPNGGDPNAVRFTKKLPKTLCFNPITGHIRDTTSYMPNQLNAAEPNPIHSSLTGPTKQQLNFTRDYVNNPAFSQPSYTKRNPKVQIHNPITGAQGRDLSYLAGDMKTTSYSMEFGARRDNQRQLQQYGSMAMNQ